MIFWVLRPYNLIFDLLKADDIECPWMELRSNRMREVCGRANSLQRYLPVKICPCTMRTRPGALQIEHLDMNVMWLANKTIIVQSVLCVVLPQYNDASMHNGSQYHSIIHQKYVSGWHYDAISCSIVPKRHSCAGLLCQRTRPQLSSRCTPLPH